MQKIIIPILSISLLSTIIYATTIETNPEAIIEKENREAILSCLENVYTQTGTTDMIRQIKECESIPLRSITWTGQLTPVSEPPSIKWTYQTYFIAEPPNNPCDDWKSTPKRVILHYTATSYDTTVSSIANWHKARFWVNYFIAYHYLIKKNWQVIMTRPEKCWSIAMKSEELNKKWIHIAYIWDWKPTEEQNQSLIELTRGIQDRYKMERDSVDAHADHEAKNHKESMDWMFGSKEEFVKLLRLQDKITIYWKESAELTYVWHAWWDKDFIGTIFAESRFNNNWVWDGGNSFWYCQIHKWYQPWWHSEYMKLKTMEERLNYCHEKYIYSSTLPWGIGSRFHWYNARIPHIQNIKTF